ncbi:MAG TPA: DUF2917 domain-containing protein [Myxococcaceae bacterium]|nr:DUF2917 domain-containing protein [Myxococcaceae bacterium]
MPKFAEQEIVLPPNTTAGFAVPPRGVRITCLSGTLWVTGVGDPQDYLLSAGQKFVPRFGGRLVVESMAAAPARFLLQRSANQQGERWLTPPSAEAATSLEAVAWQQSQ